MKFVKLIKANKLEYIYKKLRQYMSTHIDDLVDYANEDGFDAELLSDEFMLIRDNNEEYRAHIDKAGDTYYIDNVEKF